MATVFVDDVPIYNVVKKDLQIDPQDNLGSTERLQIIENEAHAYSLEFKDALKEKQEDNSGWLK